MIGRSRARAGMLALGVPRLWGRTLGLDVSWMLPRLELRLWFVRLRLPLRMWLRLPLRVLRLPMGLRLHLALVLVLERLRLRLRLRWLRLRLRLRWLRLRCALGLRPTLRLRLRLRWLWLRCALGLLWLRLRLRWLRLRLRWLRLRPALRLRLRSALRLRLRLRLRCLIRLTLGLGLTLRLLLYAPLEPSPTLFLGGSVCSAKSRDEGGTAELPSQPGTTAVATGHDLSLIEHGKRCRCGNAIKASPACRTSPRT